MRISDWSSAVCSSDLRVAGEDVLQASAALEVPEPHRAVVAGRNRVAAAVDQRHGVHRALVVVEHLDGLLVLQVPQDKAVVEAGGDGAVALRSEEHTSELQSLMRISYAVFCLKKKNKNNNTVRQLTTQYKQTIHRHN